MKTNGTKPYLGPIIREWLSVLLLSSPEDQTIIWANYQEVPRLEFFGHYGEMGP